MGVVAVVVHEISIWRKVMDRLEQDSQEKEQKKQYAKPTIKQVDLRPEEAVLGFCKSSVSAGPASSMCTIPGCSSPGS